jgi:UDP-glucuronate 4-epimerase
MKNRINVIGLDSLSNYYDVNLKKDRLKKLEQNKQFTKIIGKLEDPKVWKKIHSKYEVKKVFHLAAQAGVRHSIDHPSDYLSSNIQGTFNVLEFCKYHKVKHLLLASTSSVYGHSNKKPLDELMKSNHQMSFYAATKKSTEVMAHSYSHIYELPVTAFRFFTVYGPWGRPDMALFKFTKNIINGKKINVFNKGDMKRDFTYVDDLCRSIYGLSFKIPYKVSSSKRDLISNIDSISEIAPFRIVNIGSCNPVSLEYFIEIIEKELSIKAYKKYLPMQMGDIKETHASIDLLEHLIGPQKFTSIPVGISRFIKWYKEYYSVK